MLRCLAVVHSFKLLSDTPFYNYIIYSPVHGDLDCLCSKAIIGKAAMNILIYIILKHQFLFLLVIYL